jgi:hypothetical protein
MWARVTTFVIPADAVDRAIEEIDKAIAAFREKPGLVRIDLYANRRSGATITISLWETEEAMRASDEDAEHSREDITLEVIGWTQQVAEYELIRSGAP